MNGNDLACLMASVCVNNVPSIQVQVFLSFPNFISQSLNSGSEGTIFFRYHGEVSQLNSISDAGFILRKRPLIAYRSLRDLLVLSPPELSPGTGSTHVAANDA